MARPLLIPRQSVFLLACLVAGCSGAQAGSGPRVVRSLAEMRSERVVLQRWDLICGAAALATLLNFQHGDPVGEREVALGLMGRDEYLANPMLVRARLGFSLLDLKRYVDHRGYRGEGFGQLELRDLEERAPVLTPIVQGGYSHFVIFRGRERDRVLLADPAFGTRTMLVEQFERVWAPVGNLGHVGFVVVRAEGLPPPDRLRPRADEFLNLD